MGEKKNDGENNKSNNVVLKIDMHCEGCYSKIIKYLRGFPGVESVKAESETGKITITGKVDPSKVKEKLAEKTKKKVELVSPQPKKEKENNNNNNNKKSDDSKKNKEKEPPVTTAVLKVALHCQGCIDRIGKTVMKTKGVHELSIDKEKETVTVKGTMDVKALAGNLMEKLKRKVEVVPPKKDSNNSSGGSDNKEGSNKKKTKGGGGGDGNEDGVGGKIMEQQNTMMMDHFAVAPPLHFGFGYGVVPHGYNNGGFVGGGGIGNGNVVGGYGYTYVPVYPHHAPQIFSDENPNACSVM